MSVFLYFNVFDADIVLTSLLFLTVVPACMTVQKLPPPFAPENDTDAHQKDADRQNDYD
ncbi:MAG: hypothetical protein J6C81_00520 [Muribaculaceae bacterium]|nr:hypothetical protein [Muribaculaceae bacterium]